ncbi:MAG: low molecular weight protein-tyrosine-phosphatase [Bacteroidia bacterium]
MVCLGNICRSPLADGILRFKAKRENLDWIIDSAGTYSGHQGEHPDYRAIKCAKKFGVDISQLIARPFSKMDFNNFDKIYVMDSSNYRDVLKLTDNDADHEKVEMIMNVVNPGRNQAVPDPYWGGDEDFDNVFKMLDEACEKIIQQLK